MVNVNVEFLLLIKKHLLTLKFIRVQAHPRMGDSHIADFEYHEIPQVVKVITSVVLGLSRVAAGHE